jgi:phospholipid-binding lipoprotein MlaA
MLLLAACATPENRDPFERINRHIFEFNDAMDAGIIRPAAESYRATVPEPARRGIRNVLNNLQEPVVFINNLLQFRLADAGTTLVRFSMNTTAGVLGLMDVATPAGHPQRLGDFGQTLYAAGIGDGPFLMLPLLGPSNVRDAIGGGVDSFIDPIGHATGHALPRTAASAVGIGRGVVRGIDLRAENIENLDALRADSLDYYARLRSVVQQRRDAQLGRTSGTTGEGLVTLEDPGG